MEHNNTRIDWFGNFIDSALSPSAKKLIVVSLLPLVDGVFLTLLLSGEVTSILAAVKYGILLFGGAGTLAIILTEFPNSLTERLEIVSFVGLLLLFGSAGVALLASSLSSMFYTPTLRIFAALVIGLIGVQTVRNDWNLPNPASVAGVGVLLSIRPNMVTEFSLTYEPQMLFYAIVAGLTGVLFALTVAVLRELIEGEMNMAYLRYGCAVSLGLLALAIVGLIPSIVSIVVFCASGVVAYMNRTKA